MKIDYFIASCSNKTSVEAELAGLINEFNASLSKTGIKQSNIIRLVVFYNPNGSVEILNEIKNNLSATLKLNIPISYVAQPPKGGQNVILEAAFINDENVNIEHCIYQNHKYVKAKVNYEEHMFVSGLQHEDWNVSIKDHSEYAFQALEDVLMHEGFSFKNIVRQWNYIQGIIAQNNDDQNYQVFNDVRTKYYEKNGLTARYPAATGIGVKEGGVVIDVHAVKDHASVQLEEIANPLQIDAFAYSENVLEGKPLDGFVCKTTPKFSRAKLVVNSKQAQVMVSGTASIHGEETIGVDNVEEQTKYTIDNIYQLINPELLATFNPLCKNAQQSFTSVRVYVKNQEHFDTVKRICEQKFNTENIIYVEADVCRDNLLVEIEGVVSLLLNP